MYFAWYYMIAALLLITAAVVTPSIYFKVPLAWGSLSVFTVSIAYFFDIAAIFRKREDGRIPTYIRWIFVPFLLGAQVYNAWARKRDKVPAIQQIEEKLYLACRLFPSDVEYLKKQQIGAVLDVTAEFDGLDWSLLGEEIRYLNIPVLDHRSPTLARLQQALNWIDNQQRNGRKVLVHCALGRGRSVLVVAAHLLSQNKTGSVKEVLKQIKSIRQTANLNHYQFNKLMKLHKAGKLHQQLRAWIIANPVAGGGKWDVYKQELVNRLSQHYQLTIRTTTKDIDGETLTKQAVKEKADLVVACGGDGTVTEVASALINTDIALGIIPMGTANALSQALCGGISKIIPLETACRAITEGNTISMDSATCNGKLMLLLAGVGFEEKMVSSADRDTKNNSGQMAYLHGLWQAIEQNSIYTLTVQFDNHPPEEIDTQSLVVANAAPFTTLLAQGKGQPDVDDGKLDVTWLTGTNASDTHLVSLAELAFSGLTQDKSEGQVKHRQVERIRISGEQLEKYVIDGEIYHDTSLDIQIQPNSLLVRVPGESLTD
ncbi:diacylglycerol kinase family protein [Lacimicrobium alkaliphilum]|uniref:Diacylglycerol kinase catalytic subunit n=1 Tax=Lacimicrobium alkaliphilum TaxID=1526571 RepID=A0ABQ1REU6_9ALTE|nr:diacylglycerol kinase family protein [Lacimicrobium alkaliphilum]GGD65661.1 diacylglycerol kinase catalytic subunit [Lacimicrobium alkaliphilum]